MARIQHRPRATRPSGQRHFPLRTSEMLWRHYVDRLSTSPGDPRVRMGKAKSSTPSPRSPMNSACFEPVLTSLLVSYGQSILSTSPFALEKARTSFAVCSTSSSSRSTVEPPINAPSQTQRCPTPLMSIAQRWSMEQHALASLPSTWSFEAEGASINSTTLELNGVQTPGQFCP